MYPQVSASGLSRNSSAIDLFRPATRADYRYLGLLGQGQFAQIYCAVYRRTGQLVAIKETRHAPQRASQEPFILQTLAHPNIIGCQSIAKTKIGHRLVLEYCEAGTLRSHLKGTQNTSDSLPLGDTQLLMTDLLEGLSYLHQCGIAHGDLKPENLLLTWKTPLSNNQKNHKVSRKKGRTQNRLVLKIGDFGSAVFLDKSGRSSEHDLSNQTSISQKTAYREMGSPTYAAPERFDNPPSIASDLYAVGVMIYELLLGDRPFSGPPHVLEKSHKTDQISLPSSLTPQLKQLLTKALHKQPEQRFASATELKIALRQLSAITAQPINLSTIPTDIPETSLSQVMTKVPIHGITPPIESLLHVPQGCCIVTAKSLHLVTPKRNLLSIARFKQPHWIAVAPNGKWFTAIAKKDDTIFPEKSASQKKTRYRFSQGMVGHFLSNQSGHQWRRTITLKGKLLTELRAKVLKIIILNNRYLLRISTTQSKTFFECFTRRGQFIGELSVNFRITQVTLTATPYQLIAIKAPKTTTTGTDDNNTHSSDSVVFITLKPFQVRTVALPIAAEQVSALSWGYIVSYQRNALLLDRSAQITSALTGLPTASRLATLNKRTLLLANSTLSSTVSTSTQRSPIAYKSSEPLSLLIADTSALDLGLIF